MMINRRDDSSSLLEKPSLNGNSDDENVIAKDDNPKPKIKKKSVLSKLAKKNFFVQPNFVLSDSDETSDSLYSHDNLSQRSPGSSTPRSPEMQFRNNKKRLSISHSTPSQLNTVRIKPVISKSESNLSLNMKSNFSNEKFASSPKVSLDLSHSVNPEKLPKITSPPKSLQVINSKEPIMQCKQTPVINICVTQEESPQKLFVEQNSKTDVDSDSIFEERPHLSRRFTVGHTEHIPPQAYRHLWNFLPQPPCQSKTSIKRLHETSSSGEELDLDGTKGRIRKLPLISWTRPLDSDTESQGSIRSWDPVSEFKHSNNEFNGRSPKHKTNDRKNWQISSVESSYEKSQPDILFDNLSLKSTKGRLEPLFLHPPRSPPLSDDSSILQINSLKREDFKLSTSQRSLNTSFSDRTSNSSSALPQISTKQARSRSYLHGNISTNALLGSTELDRYFPDRRAHIFVGTWNMGDQPAPESLNDFLLPNYCDYVPDIYAVGVQEGLSNRKEWEIKMQETIGPSHVLFFSAMLGVLHQAVFIRRDLIWFVSIPEHDVVSTRPGTMVKTKGAIAMSFTIFGTSFLFITSHFTAHENKIQERIADYKKIVQALDLPKYLPSNPYTGSTDVTGKFDCVFWSGDMNFRIEKERNTVETLIAKINADDDSSFEELILCDQLSKLMSEDKVFRGFQEGRINFQPSYKYDIGTDQFDTSTKLRTPSYTDRVLFKCKKKNSIICIQYNCVPTIQTSDHRPVYALFEVAIRPGRDNIPLGAGIFNREIFLEASKRRGAMEETLINTKESTVCVLQ